MFSPERFLSNALQTQPGGYKVAQVLAHAFNAVDPGAAVQRHLHKNPLPSGKRIFAFGLGKAACPMMNALADEVPLTDTLVITKHASFITVAPATVIEGDHPVPGIASLHAGNAAIKFLSQIDQDDLLVCLISGGGSALMTAPRIPLEDLQRLTSALLACGARIDEINILRRHLDQLKGGGLAKLANGAQVISLLLSDVAGDSLEAIASGPTVPDPTTVADSISIIDKYDLMKSIPASVVNALTETLKPNDLLFEKVQNTVIASNSIALQTAKGQAELLGFQTKIVDTNLQGLADTLGGQLAAQLKNSLQGMPRPFCLLAGGEATVKIKGTGRGGRNQELALAAVDSLAGLQNVLFLSIATDGEDGPTDAAGAFVTGETAQRAESLGLYAADYLLNNDAYSYFEQVDQLIKTGPSGTNVNDLVICFAF